MTFMPHLQVKYKEQFYMTFISCFIGAKFNMTFMPHFKVKYKELFDKTFISCFVGDIHLFAKFNMIHFKVIENKEQLNMTFIACFIGYIFAKFNILRMHSTLNAKHISLIFMPCFKSKDALQSSIVIKSLTFSCRNCNFKINF